MDDHAFTVRKEAVDSTPVASFFVGCSVAPLLGPFRSRKAGATCFAWAKRPAQWCDGAPDKEGCSRGGVHGFCARSEGMIVHSISWWCKNGASHRKNFDTPPLKGSCKCTTVHLLRFQEHSDFRCTWVHL